MNCVARSAMNESYYRPDPPWSRSSHPGQDTGPAEGTTPAASGLAFASLLALVPISALLFSLFSGFGAFTSIVESIQAFLIRILVPTQQEEILTYVSRVVENTSGLGVFGLVFFLITSVFLLAGIQRTFDLVWGTVSKRNAVRN